ncbi:MAG: V-type ATP synthase subunit E [Lachnospiraceae bacterium]|nr:V-type ATP synthase subunit E [Lachnospiraceae bacterium]
MSGLEKILEHIKSEATDTADEMLRKAKAEAEKIVEAEKKDAAFRADQIKKQSELDVTAANSRIQSAGDLKEKRMILEAKQKEIDDVFTATMDYLANLDDAAYFEIIERMIPRYADGIEGTIRFNAKDLARVPESTKKVAKDNLLTLSDEPAEIDGGFILVYRNIEENCSFDALISASREDLQDKIGQILFS